MSCHTNMPHIGSIVVPVEQPGEVWLLLEVPNWRNELARYM